MNRPYDWEEPRFTDLPDLLINRDPECKSINPGSVLS
jgi:hypothetical protein